jgi:hypothetical protein
VIDGRIGPEEWKYAAAVSLFEWGSLRQEQPVFYVFRDAENLYVAMESIDSTTNGIVAGCSQHDRLNICGDDCRELMIAPGAGEDVKRFDFPAFYYVLNSIGTIWDCKFIPLCAEDHNSWESGAEFAHEVDGTDWSCEMRVPQGKELLIRKAELLAEIDGRPADACVTEPLTVPGTVLHPIVLHPRQGQTPSSSHRSMSATDSFAARSVMKSRALASRLAKNQSMPWFPVRRSTIASSNTV